MITHKIKEMLATLAEFEKDIPAWDRTRSRILDDLRYGEKSAPAELQQLIDQRRDMVEALRSLELAIKNSAANFARFETKAAKDVQTLAEAKKKGGGSSFDDKHPILVAQRQAFARVSQRLGFLDTELDKLRGALIYKYHKVQGFRELDALTKALTRDAATFSDGKSPFSDMIKIMDDMAKRYRLSR